MKGRGPYYITHGAFLALKAPIPVDILNGRYVLVVGVKAWRAPDEDGLRRFWRADGKCVTLEQHFGKEHCDALREEQEKRAARILNETATDSIRTKGRCCFDDCTHIYETGQPTRVEKAEPSRYLDSRRMFV